MQKKRYLEQAAYWPVSGRHIMAHFDAETVTVYQAYGPDIAEYAVEHQRFGGAFSYDRMSWIKPNFLWMMYRSGWASKEGQERILAVRLRRHFFEEMLCNVVPSTFDPVRYASQKVWQVAIANSDLRLQWDPDHNPSGKPVERRALQIGLRGAFLRRYGQNEVVSITDVTPFVIEQRGNVIGDFSNLVIPEEKPYAIGREAALALGINLITAP